MDIRDSMKRMDSLVSMDRGKNVMLKLTSSFLLERPP